jgi:hypothetical protein
MNKYLFLMNKDYIINNESITRTQQPRLLTPKNTQARQQQETKDQA